MEQIPPPNEIKHPYGNRRVYGSSFDTSVVMTLTRHIRGNKIVFPVSFQRECKREVFKHIPTIQSWFTPSPPKDTLERLIEIPSEIPITENENKLIANGSVVAKMKGILIEDARILPDIRLETITLTSSTNPSNVRETNTKSSKDELIEIDELDFEKTSEMPFIINDDASQDGNDSDIDGDDNLSMGGSDDDEYDDDDDEDDEDDDNDDDDEDDDNDDAQSEGYISGAIEKIQNRLDRVREDLEELRRLRKKTNNKS